MGRTATFTIAKNRRRLARFTSILTLLVLSAAVAQTPATEARARQTPQAAECQSGVGARLFSNGGALEVEMLPADAGFTIELHLMSPGPDRLIATNREPGTIVKLGTFPAGVELIFGIFVRETQRTFITGPGSGNPDGLPHAELACFGGGRTNIGFEDQMGGGDRDYNDLLCAVRQSDGSCSYSVAPKSQSFDPYGGKGTISVSARSGCSWTAVSNVSWVAIVSGGSGSDNGNLKYEVGVNANQEARVGTLSVQGETFTVHQDGAGSAPLITSIVRSGKKLFLYGINFDNQAVILMNGDQQKTKYDEDNPTTVLIGKKAGNWVQPGDTIQVRSGSGVLSLGFTYQPQ